LPLDLRAPSADRCETLRCDQYLGHFISQVQKFKGFGGQKHAKFGAILRNFLLWSRICPERDAFRNWKNMWSRTIPSSFGERSLV